MNTLPFGQSTTVDSQPLDGTQKERTRTELQLDQANEVVDLMLDDILRIQARLRERTGLPPTFVTEIEGICDRAVNYSRQRVPLIVQRDNAERERDRLKLENYDLKQQIVYMEDMTAPDGRPSFQQGGEQHEIQEVVTAEFCTGLVDRINTLRKQLDNPPAAQNTQISDPCAPVEVVWGLYGPLVHHRLVLLRGLTEDAAAKAVTDRSTEAEAELQILTKMPVVLPPWLVNQS